LAITTCIKSGVLAEFLTENYEEVAQILCMEYDQDLEHQVLREEAMEDAI